MPKKIHACRIDIVVPHLSKLLNLSSYPPPFPHNLGPPISQDVFFLTSICTVELTWTIVSLKRQVRWVLQPMRITSEIPKHLILFVGVRLLATLPPSGGLGTIGQA